MGFVITYCRLLLLIFIFIKLNFTANHANINSHKQKIKFFNFPVGLVINFYTNINFSPGIYIIYSSDKLLTKCIVISYFLYSWCCSPDASMIYVKVGFGFFLEMTHDEALAFIEKKVSMINSKIDVLTKDAAKIKAHIKLVLQVRCTYIYLVTFVTTLEQ